MMDLEEKRVEFHAKMNNMDDVEVKESVDSQTGLERIRMAEERCLMLENEVTKLKSELMLMNGRFEAIEVEKLAVEDELGVLRKRNEDLQKRVISQGGVVDGLIDLTDEMIESDMVADLMIENKVLECEKKKAESEVEIWKTKFKELEDLLTGSGENSLLRKVEGSMELPEMVKEITEATESEDGLTKSMPFHTENKIEHGEKIIDADSCMDSTLYCHDKGNVILESSGTPITQSNTLVEKEDTGILPDNKLIYSSRVRKQLFKEAGTGSPSKNMSPSMPAGARPVSVCVIDIADSDCESDTKSPKTKFTMIKKLKRMILEESDEEVVDGHKGSSTMTMTATPKRKRASNIVTSDSGYDDDDDNDNTPICKLISHPQEELDIDSHLSSIPAEKDKEDITGRFLRLRKCEIKDESQRSSPSPSKPLTRLRRCELKYELKRSSSSPSELKTGTNECLANEDADDEDMGEGDGTESEGDSLGGFIVESSDERGGSTDDSEGGDDESVSGDAAGDESDDDLDGNLDVGEIMSKIRRKRNQKNLKWEFEADMLASFGKDPEMCMKAVCAVYRQQTADEKNCKGTIHCNKRGFSQCDASRGTKLAEFLTDGDPKGDLVKSVDQLEAYNPRGAELCRKLATHYSKQLFEIYQKKEDPFFLPSS